MLYNIIFFISNGEFTNCPQTLNLLKLVHFCILTVRFIRLLFRYPHKPYKFIAFGSIQQKYCIKRTI